MNLVRKIVRALLREEFLKAAEKAQSWHEVIAICRRHAYGAR
jgi:hypothetical protein